MTMLEPEDKLSPAAVESWRIQSLPPNFYYIPNFITVEEESSILQKVRINCHSYLIHLLRNYLAGRHL